MPRGFAPAKKDSSQPAIEKAFERAGWVVCDVHALGRNAPDLFVAKAGVTIAIECKSGSRKRKEHQVEWAELWPGLYLWGSNPLTLLEDAEVILRKEQRDEQTTSDPILSNQ